jgi:NDP-sugar pyrophosphorylase family protein
VLPVRGKPLLAHWLDAFHAQQLPLQLYVVYRYRWAQVMDVIREWQSRQEKSILRVDAVQEEVFPDRIWEDLQAFWTQTGGERLILKHRRRDPEQPLLFANGDNWGEDLPGIVADMLAMQNWLSEDIWGVMGLIGADLCSKATEEAIVSDRIAESLWWLRDYRYGLEEGHTAYLSWAGIGLFSSQAIDATRDCSDPRAAIQKLAQMGKLAGWRIWQQFMDVGTIEGYRKVGAI